MAFPVPFYAACDVNQTNTYDTCGTVTLAKLKPLAPSAVQALFTDGTKWHEMNAMLKTQFEMKACGTRRYGMYDWLISSNRPGMGKLISPQPRHKGPSLIQPFILGRQESVVNTDYWYVEPTKGWPTTGTGAYAPGAGYPLSNLAGGTRVIRAKPGYGLVVDDKWFLPGHQLYILNKVSNAAKHGQWGIVRAAADPNGLFVDVLLENLNSFQVEDVDETPTSGLVLIGSNNVHPAESWCYNPANINPTKYVPYWFQHMRRTRCISSEYRKVFADLMADNAWYAAFQDLPIAERNRQDELNYQKQWVHTFFYGRPYNSNQTLALWGDLPQIASATGAAVDPGTDGQLQAYRANLVGVYEQLKSCTQYGDSAGSPLEIEDFLEGTIYDIMRARESRGRPARSIDIYTDSTTAGEFLVAFIAYANNVLGSGVMHVNFIQEGQNDFGFNWKTYTLFKKPQGVKINIITNEFFDDQLNLFTDAALINQASRGRFLAVLDVGAGGSMYPALLGSSRKTFKTGQLEDLAKIDESFACVMENPTFERSLTSELWTAIVECPKNSWWQENFSSVRFVA